MRFTAPLDDVLRSSTHVRVLRALHEVPRGFAISGREVARRAGVSHPSAAKVLGSLVEQGLARARRSAHADEFDLNTDHVFAGQLQQLFLQERRLLDEVRDLVRYPLEQAGVRTAFLFGSVVAGGASATSDIDLAVEPPAYGADRLNTTLDELRAKVSARFGNQLHVVVKTSPSTARSEALWRRLTRDGVSVVPS